MAQGHWENRVSSDLLLKRSELKLLGTHARGLWCSLMVPPKPCAGAGG